MKARRQPRTCYACPTPSESARMEHSPLLDIGQGTSRRQRTPPLVPDVRLKARRQCGIAPLLLVTGLMVAAWLLGWLMGYQMGGAG